MAANHLSLPRSVRAGAVTAVFLWIAPALTTLSNALPAQAQVLTPAKQLEAAGTYAVEKSHSDVSFTVVHMALTKVHGHFGDFDGTVKLDGKNVGDSTVVFTIKTDSVNTDSAPRDTHLKSDAFFDVAKNPEITFKSTKITKHKNGYDAIGTLTMHGVTKDVVLPFTVAGPVTGMDKKPHLGVEVTLNLKRSDYGITYGPGVVSDDVAVTIDLDLVKQ